MSVIFPKRGSGKVDLAQIPSRSLLVSVCSVSLYFHLRAMIDLEVCFFPCQGAAIGCGATNPVGSVGGNPGAKSRGGDWRRCCGVKHSKCFIGGVFDC